MDYPSPKKVKRYRYHRNSSLPVPVPFSSLPQSLPDAEDRIERVHDLLYIDLADHLAQPCRASFTASAMNSGAAPACRLILSARKRAAARSKQDLCRVLIATG